LEALARGVRDFAAQEGIAAVECRGALGLPSPEWEKYFIEEKIWDYGSLRLGPPEELFRKIVDHQVRKAVQKAQRGGLEVVERHDSGSLRDWFYPFYLRYMKTRHGSPPQPLELFLGFAKEMENHLKVFYAFHQGRLAAALLGYAVGRRIYISQAPAEESLLPLRASDLLHWSFIEWGCRSGFEYFDFGHARYEGQRYYKAKWGCAFAPYKRFFIPLVPDFRPERILDPGRLPYRIAAGIWKRSVPLSWTPALGRWIHRLLGD